MRSFLCAALFLSAASLAFAQDGRAQASAKPVTPGAMTEYQIQIFPTLATIAAGNRLRLTLATADTPHLTPLPGELPELAGGVYTIARSAASPSSVTVELLK